MKIQKKIFFITGLWGTGKSTLVETFRTFSHEPFELIDFDYGGGFDPPTDRSKHHDWRVKQSEYWLDYAHQLIKEDISKVPVICGVTLYPSQLLKLKAGRYLTDSDLGFAHLTVADDERKRRLIERGDGEIFTLYKEWYSDFYEELKKVNSYGIDTTHLSKTEVANTVYQWLTYMRNNRT